MEALIKIQEKLKAPKNQFNKFGNYKYRNCEDILEAVKPLLVENKCRLTLTDEVKEIGGVLFVEATAILKEDGNDNVITVKASAGIEPNRKGMDISQSFGSSSSYARKYALNGLFLIDDNKDADNEQHEQTQQSQKNGQKPTNNKPWLNPETDKWKDAIKFLAGNGTIDKIKENYLISKPNEEKLQKDVLNIMEVQ